MTRVTTAYVLAAGLGTRLRPLTNDRPKPLVEVCGTPLIEHALRLLEDAGVRRAAINSHWLHPQIPDALGDRFGAVELCFTHEPVVLGTGGGLVGLRAALPPPPGEKVLVLNADALIDLDLRRLIDEHAASSDLAALVVKDDPDTARYGALGTDVDERITSFAGRIEPIGPVVRERMFCGVHLVDPRAFDVLPAVALSSPARVRTATGVESGINDEGYPKWMARGAVLRAFHHDGAFCDVGTPERLFEANMRLLDGSWSRGFLRPFRAPLVEREPGVVVHPASAVRGVVEGPALIDDGARVDGRVVRSVIGKGAVVPAGITVRRSVLLAGAEAREDLDAVVVWPGGTLRIAPAVADRICGNAAPPS